MGEFLKWVAEYWWLLFFFCLCFGGGITAGAKYLIQQWQEGRRRAQENELKREMIAKGFHKILFLLNHYYEEKTGFED